MIKDYIVKVPLYQIQTNSTIEILLSDFIVSGLLLCRIREQMPGVTYKKEPSPYHCNNGKG